ncbi:hypothetical protein IJ541_02460 [bacterium]|nr:hypothetical protein [bacterium]
MSGVEFNGRTEGITFSSGVNAENNIQQTNTLGLMGYGNNSSEGVGYTVESVIPGLDLVVAHFAGVPDKPEYNIGQKNLVITGALMGGACEETAEV